MLQLINELENRVRFLAHECKVRPEYLLIKLVEAALIEYAFAHNQDPSVIRKRADSFKPKC